MTRKEYVVKVVESLQENPKAVFAGHGLKPQFLKIIASRPDTIAKMCVLAWASKTYKKGKNALKKTNNFKIGAYKNFANFNFDARKDVEEFMAKLSPADAATFTNSDNIVTIIILPDTVTGNLENDIVNGKSVVVPFDKSILKAYNIPGGMYVTMMFGDSYVLPRAEKEAKAKAPINDRVVARRTPAKVKESVVAKAKAKLLALKNEGKDLAFRASKTAAELQQIASVASMVSGTALDDPSEMMKAIKAYNNTNKLLLSELAPFEKQLYVKAANLYRKGKKIAANRILAEIGVPALTELVKGGNLVSTDAIVAERAKKYRAKIKEINEVNTMLLARLEAATTAKAKADTRFAINKNTERIKLLRAKMTTFSKGVNVGVIRNKASLLAKTSKMIEENLLKGATIQQALNSAVSKLPVSEQVKQQVKQQVIEQVANGTPMQFAVQQSIQSVTAEVEEFQDLDAVDYSADAIYNENLDDDEFANQFLAEEEFDSLATSLAGTKSIKEILSIL